MVCPPFIVFAPSFVGGYMLGALFTMDKDSSLKDFPVALDKAMSCIVNMDFSGDTVKEKDSETIAKQLLFVFGVGYSTNFYPNERQADGEDKGEQPVTGSPDVPQSQSQPPPPVAPAVSPQPPQSQTS